MSRHPLPLSERYRVTDTGCWEWLGARTARGYGRAWFEGKSQKAHRVFYALHVGPVTGEVDHLCRNRACVNPDHLEVVTRQENVRRSSMCFDLSGTCRAGLHPAIPDNIIVTIERGKPRRRCRPCKNDHLRRWRAERAVA